MDYTKVTDYFRKVCSIPRASGDEKELSDYIVTFAQERGLKVRQDSMGNVIVWKPANGGTGAPLILQAHLDMVYVKENDSSHRYEDGITIEENDGFYYAEGTSLGADNGVAVAYGLALMDSTQVKHPDLELIFTVKEEVGLVGANAIDISELKGTRLINLDSEEEGVFCVSCAGGLRCQQIWNLQLEPSSRAGIPVKISFLGLAGGHSGMNIGMGLGNAIVLLGRLLYQVKGMGIRIMELDAPGKTNAIASTAVVSLSVPENSADEFIGKVKEMEAVFCAELQHTDHLSLQIEKGNVAVQSLVYTEEFQERIINSLLLLPNGVAGYSFAVDGLIETSMNLGVLTQENGTLTLQMALRSSVESQKYMLRDKIQTIADTWADECIFESDYPGWQYRMESPLRDTAVALYKRMFQKEARIEAIHAGLECGYWDSKNQDLI